ncbi:phage tail protein [Pseudochelatococcus sp. G4_1912]|uniref:phage tail protein n=1 Tax=Pseudochelatococcus sp. G4_1912 TaxID=3114288 RepID=UPI0039C6FE35
MSGPVTMSLGPYAFEAHGFGYTDITRSLTTSWSSVDVVDRMEVLQWTGPKSEAVSIKGVLFPAEFGGEDSLEGIRSAAQKGEPLMLVSLDGGVFGQFVIEAVNEERAFIDPRGMPRKNAWSIELKRFEQAGSGQSGGASQSIGLF